MYVVEMESDIECECCGKEFNSKKNAIDRVMPEFQIDENGKNAESGNYPAFEIRMMD